MASPRLWIVRIGPKSPKKDYEIFIEQIQKNNVGIWDKDSKNQIKKNDYLGFITGPMTNLIITFYKVTDEYGTEKRESHWKKNAPYTTGNGVSGVGYRETIYLVPTGKIMLWSTLREKCKYKPKYIPRGTHRIPKNFEEVFSQ